MGIVDHERDAESSSSPSEGSSSTSTEYTSSPHPRDGSEQQPRRGHYRGMTFDDILPSHMITTAPPPGVEQKQKQGRSKPIERRHSTVTAAPTSPSTSMAMATMEPRPPSTKRNYPAAKKQSSGGGKSRLQATARALVRGFSVVKRNSRGRGSGYEAV
jgi:hypothetical protein